MDNEIGIQILKHLNFISGCLLIQVTGGNATEDGLEELFEIQKRLEDETGTLIKKYKGELNG